MFDDLRFRLRALFRRDPAENQLDEELRFHFDREVTLPKLPQAKAKILPQVVDQARAAEGLFARVAKAYEFFSSESHARKSGAAS